MVALVFQETRINVEDPVLQTLYRRQTKLSNIKRSLQNAVDHFHGRELTYKDVPFIACNDPGKLTQKVFDVAHASQAVQNRISCHLNPGG